jgi:hypothetical protein
MSWNGAGVFTRLYSWVTDYGNSLPISPTRIDADTNDIVGGLNNCLTRDGQGKPSANLNMNGFKITNMAAATIAGDAVRYEQVSALITSLPGVTSINSGYLYGNRVINGAQEIDQVNSGAAVTPATSPAYLTDMFGAFLSQASKLTFQQVADAPAGLKNSLKVTVAAQYSPAATDAFTLVTAIEGKDVIDFQMGTSGAATFTLSHWIKGSVAGTYAIALRNAATNRSYLGTVSVTTVWTQVNITVTGDLTGTWAKDNTIGLSITWDLGSGTNFNTTAGSWQAGNFTNTSGSVTFVNQVAGSTLNITGVDCRLGLVAPTYFERRANELQLAQRYYEKSYGDGVAPGSVSQGGAARGVSFSGFDFYASSAITFKTSKRAICTFNFWSPATGNPNVFRDETAVGDIGVPAVLTNSTTGATLYNSSSIFTAGRMYSVQWTASARLF